MVYLTYGDFLKILFDLSIAHDTPYDIRASYVGILIHIYHGLFFTKLTKEDIFHHVVFAGSFGSASLLYYWGPIVNMFLFFVCGFPGMIDYILLSLVKLNYIDKLTEKHLVTYIYMYIRSPGIICTVFLGLCNMLSKLNQLSIIFIFFASIVNFLMIFNAQYYLNSVIVSYNRHKLDLNFKEE
jgi:hypothetical protein